MSDTTFTEAEAAESEARPFTDDELRRLRHEPFAPLWSSLAGLVARFLATLDAAREGSLDAAWAAAEAALPNNGACVGDGLGEPSTCQRHMEAWYRAEERCAGAWRWVIDSLSRLRATRNRPVKWEAHASGDFQITRPDGIHSDQVYGTGDTPAAALLALAAALRERGA